MKRGEALRCKNEYRVDDDIAALTIYRQNGENIVTIFDACYMEQVKRYHWQYMNAGYVRTVKSQGHLSLHRLICAWRGEIIEGKVIDHINGNTLDNTSSNLRVCTQADNVRNSRNRFIGTQNVIGVRRDTRCVNSWRAQIYYGGDSRTHIEKTFRDEKLAIEQRLKWEIEFFGEFAPQIELIKSEYPYLLRE